MAGDAMKRALLWIAAVVLLAACASQPAPVAHQVPGFLAGFFHGFIAIASLIGSLFLHIRIYEFPNSGFWYDFGFVAGFCSFLLGVFLTIMARIGGMMT
jgi:4-hydroxybenzoate polyprenyltransferase